MQVTILFPGGYVVCRGSFLCVDCSQVFNYYLCISRFSEQEVGRYYEVFYQECCMFSYGRMRVFAYGGGGLASRMRTRLLKQKH